MQPAAKMHRPVTTQTTSALSIRTSTPKVIYPPVSRQLTPQRCCETGRPVMLDPLTGAAVCSCQLKAGVPAYLSRVPSLPETMYGATAGHQFPASMLMNPEATSAFYQMGLKQDRPDRPVDGMKVAPPSVGSPYYLEQLMAANPYNPFYPGFDLSNARRKNATRETTSALKAWLYEHRKNPYPTKGEKIMLAIITRMTLTQVSTWFANARRRLKKESRMEDKDLDLSDIDVDEKSDDKTKSASDEDGLNLTTDLSDISDTEDSTETSRNPHSYVSNHLSTDQRLLISDKLSNNITDTKKQPLFSKKNESFREQRKSSSSTSASAGSDKPHAHAQKTETSNVSNVPQPRPKIWSISEIINSSKDSDNKDDAKRHLD